MKKIRKGKGKRLEELGEEERKIRKTVMGNCVGMSFSYVRY